MKILVLAPQPFFQNRGTPIAVRMLSEVLQEAGHEVELLVFHEGENVDLGRIILHRTIAVPGVSNIPPGFSLKKIVCDFTMLFKAIRLCYQKKYDMVHAVEESVFIALLLKLLFGVSYIYDIDSWLSDQLIDKFRFLNFCRPVFTFFESVAVRNCRGAIAVCQALEEKVKGIDDRKPLLRLEDVSLLTTDNTGGESLHKIAGNDGEIILYVGNLETYQGIDLLLDSFALLVEKHKTSNLFIIGGTNDDVEKYKKCAEELAINSRVFFIGSRPVESLGIYLQQADLLVSTRVDGENTPMKIYSYMDSGVPVVATRIKSHTQVLDDNNSFLAAPQADEFCEILLMGLDDRENAAERARRAKEIVEKEYSRSAFQKKLTGFYSNL